MIPPWPARCRSPWPARHKQHGDHSRRGNWAARVAKVSYDTIENNSVDRNYPTREGLSMLRGCAVRWSIAMGNQCCASEGKYPPVTIMRVSPAAPGCVVFGLWTGYAKRSARTNWMQTRNEELGATPSRAWLASKHLVNPPAADLSPLTRFRNLFPQLISCSCSAVCGMPRI